MLQNQVSDVMRRLSSPTDLKPPVTGGNDGMPVPSRSLVHTPPAQDDVESPPLPRDGCQSESSDRATTEEAHQCND